MTRLDARRFATLIAAVLIACVALSGCSLIPTEKANTLTQEQRESVIGTATADVVSAAKVTPPNLTVTTTGKDGTKVEIVQPVPSEQTTTTKTEAGETSNSSAAGSAASTISIPTFIKIIGLCVAVVVFILTVGWVLRKLHLTGVAKAVGKTIEREGAEWTEYFDEKLKERAHANRTSQTNETNPAVLAALKTEEAETQRLRAEVVKPAIATPPPA